MFSALIDVTLCRMFGIMLQRNQPAMRAGSGYAASRSVSDIACALTVRSERSSVV